MPQSRNLVRRVLQVGVHRENHLAACFGETAIQSGGFAVVASELDPRTAANRSCRLSITRHEPSPEPSSTRITS